MSSPMNLKAQKKCSVLAMFGTAIESTLETIDLFGYPIQLTYKGRPK